MADDLSGFSLLELFRLEAESQTAALSAGVLAIEQRDADVDGITRTARFQRACDPQAREAVELLQQRLQGPAAIKSGERASRLGADDEDAITSMPRPERRASGGS